jgi:serine/threonine protein kinase
MEYCNGGSCSDLMDAARCSFCEDEVAVILKGALTGLVYLHHRRKVHRDVKGGNILLTSAGLVKLGTPPPPAAAAKR